jgi:hypothetical protein
MIENRAEAEGWGPHFLDGNSRTLPVFSRFLAIRRARSADVLEHFDLVNSELLIFDALAGLR